MQKMSVKHLSFLFQRASYLSHGIESTVSVMEKPKSPQFSVEIDFEICNLIFMSSLGDKGINRDRISLPLFLLPCVFLKHFELLVEGRLLCKASSNSVLPPTSVAEQVAQISLRPIPAQFRKFQTQHSPLSGLLQSLHQPQLANFPPLCFIQDFVEGTCT